MKTFDQKVYSICKEAVLEDLAKQFEIPLENTIAVGDGMVDRGMLRKAGTGIACHAPEPVQRCADVVSDDLSVVLEYI